ncbi:MAG: pyridoxamine 5'-phosphate oxidase family protein [Cocleimonas sp.]
MREQLTNALLSRYKCYKQNHHDESLQNCMHVIETMLKKTKYASLSSHGENGWCSSRLIQPFLDNNNPSTFSLWFGTGTHSRKTEEIWNNSKVTLSFNNTREDTNLVIYGEAVIEINPDIKRKYWKSFLQLFFPNGPLADDYAVIRIEPKRIEIISFKKNIIPEPFGLKAIVLLNKQGQWQIS